jgi:hypothetical protein
MSNEAYSGQPSSMSHQLSAISLQHQMDLCDPKLDAES